MSSAGRGRARMDRDPDDYGTESPILYRLSIWDSKETGGINGVALRDSSVDQVVDFGTNRVPNAVERRAVERTGNSACRGHPGFLLPARAVE